MNYRELPNITLKQKEIMDLVFRFRFINRKQIQRLLNHKDPKRINAWLKDLVDKKYLSRIYSHKLLENTKPAIYFLNNNGILWARYEKGQEYRADDWQLDIKYLKKFYQDKHASQTFINHCIALSEFYTQFKEYERSINKDKKKEVIEYSLQTKT
ncbi:MAG TPA: replication-relaxation family protein [Patescibacteria group bacterium]|nr:replication-relaxation family protein [Patescibacteria group bacterium]